MKCRAGGSKVEYMFSVGRKYLRTGRKNCVKIGKFLLPDLPKNKSPPSAKEQRKARNIALMD